MEYRQLDGSDVKITPVTFGAWAIGGWMWGGQDADDALAALHRAVEVGMTTIDTAPMYGFGRSEEFVGRAVKDFRRDEVQLLTKYALRWSGDEGEFYFETELPDGTPAKVYKNARPDSIVHEVEQSLRRLGTDYIDLYQCHWRDHTTEVEETMGAIDKLLQQGKIRAAGVSNFTVEEIAAAASVVPLASNQPPFSMVRRDAENDVIPYCREHGIATLVYSPLQQGLLTGKIKPDTTFSEGDQRNRSKLFKPPAVNKVNAMLDEMRPVVEAHDATLAQLVINWTIHRPGVTAALVGARNPKQAEENARAASFKLTDDETARIDALVDALDLEA